MTNATNQQESHMPPKTFSAWRETWAIGPANIRHDRRKSRWSDAKWQKLGEVVSAQYDGSGMTQHDVHGLAGWMLVEFDGKDYLVYVAYSDRDGTYVESACTATR